jgi:dihydrofolate synthase / folylpolyglutamate synthase
MWQEPMVKEVLQVLLPKCMKDSGYKVGLYTSPFLIHHNDRFRINGVDMSDEDLLRYINMTTHLWETYALTMFEIDTLNCNMVFH